MTNLINCRPAGNKFELFCASKKEVEDAYPGYNWPAIEYGKYLRPEYLPEISRLYNEIESLSPNLIVALGNKACWGVLRAINIGSIRGAITQSVGLTGLARKVLPTYHPAGILRNWSWRPIVVADLMKAWRECQFPEIRRPRRQILINPELWEVRKWIKQALAADEYIYCPAAPRLAVDSETSLGTIDTLGFARSRDEALVIPFGPHRVKIGSRYHTFYPIRHGKPVASYWSYSEELEVWDLSQELLESSIPKVFQNGLYDYQYILPMAIRPQACLDDSMLLSHSMWPEMQKGLGFLGSIFTNEPSWKLMRRHRADTEKRDE